MVWLCVDHQKQDGVTVLSDAADSIDTTSLDTGISRSVVSVNEN